MHSNNSNDNDYDYENDSDSDNDDSNHNNNNNNNSVVCSAGRSSPTNLTTTTFPSVSEYSLWTKKPRA